MSKAKAILLDAASVGLLLLAAQAAAGEWHFKVANETKAKITKLQVSLDKKDWGDFDVGSGIATGETVTMEWDASTDSDPCKEWIRAKFSDGQYSAPSKQDFCQNLDDPIVFSE